MSESRSEHPLLASRGWANVNASGAMRERLCELLPEDAYGVVAYGSRARGDALPSSDLDVLVLVQDSRRTVFDGLLSISFYTENELRTGLGTLFCAHLARDGVVLWDPDRIIAPLLMSLAEPDAVQILSRITELSRLLSCLNFDLSDHGEGLLKCGRYLLRSALYAEAIYRNEPCFSVRELARSLNDLDLISLLSAGELPSDEEEIRTQARSCYERLSSLLGPLPVNQHGSLEALIVNEWSPHSDLISMALLCLGPGGRGFEYSRVRKVLL